MGARGRGITQGSEACASTCDISNISNDGHVASVTLHKVLILDGKELFQATKPTTIYLNNFNKERERKNVAFLFPSVLIHTHHYTGDWI